MPKSQKDSKRTINKKLILISIATLVFLAIFGFVLYIILGGSNKVIEVEESVILDAEYKNTDGKQIEIAKEVDEDKVVPFFENLIAEQKSFVLYVSLPICNGDAAKFKEYVLDFQRKNNLSFYYLTSDYVKELSVYKTVKYYPSVILYSNGKITNYLRYDSDLDLEYYKSYEGFERWFNANVEF
ncbi:hypothetical protein IJ768_03165 [Candidatus Saccharibacteria bacterium]|nr:hypothetical protein [Candidatus Saccharibacteria bacterium]